MNNKAKKNTQRYAVFGHPISHSLSPEIHHQFAEQTGIALLYEKIDVELSRFEEIVMDFFHQGGSGLNITLPFKERAFKLAAIKTPRSEEAGAANTLWVKNDVLYADNTDGIGFIRDLRRYIDISNKKILIVGAGGGARGVIGAILAANPSQLILSNRSMDKAEALRRIYPKLSIQPMEKLTASYDVIINATSASLDDKMLSFPKTILDSNPFCYDLAYRREGLTPFVQWAQAQGVRAIDGIGMLIEQAAEAFYIWHGVMPNTNGFQFNMST